MSVSADCLSCIDGIMPFGYHPVLGLAFVRCPVCIEHCPQCHGGGLYPASREYFQYLANALDYLGFDFELCKGCLGIVAVIGPGPEVTP